MKGFTPKNLDIMGRELCSSIMPCKVCRLVNDCVPTYPKDYTAHLTKYEVDI